MGQKRALVCYTHFPQPAPPHNTYMQKSEINFKFNQNTSSKVQYCPSCGYLQRSLSWMLIYTETVNHYFIYWHRLLNSQSLDGLHRDFIRAKQRTNGIKILVAHELVCRTFLDKSNDPKLFNGSFLMFLRNRDNAFNVHTSLSNWRSNRQNIIQQPQNRWWYNRCRVSIFLGSRIEVYVYVALIDKEPDPCKYKIDTDYSQTCAGGNLCLADICH